MNSKKILAIFSFLLVAMIFIGSVTAMDDVNIDNNLTEDSSQEDLEIADESELSEDIEVNLDEDQLTSQSDDEILSAPKTLVVEEVEEEHQEMGAQTIQPVIDDAKEGDTVIIQGKSYTHCHIVVDKKLTIVSTVGTKMSPCPSNNAESGYYGVFYIAPEASGTIIEGFTINNNVGREGSYGILVNGASDVEIRNCTFYNSGSRDAIRGIDAKNLVIHNVTSYNAENALNIVRSQNTNIYDSTFRNSKYGIRIVNSTKTTITSNNITGNSIAGIAYSGNGRDLTIIYNNITKNYNGINLTSSNNINILSNYIAFNTYNGVYVDNNITLINIKGNFFNQNTYWEIYNDYHVNNLLDYGNELEVINNNYMINYGSGSADVDRPVWTQVFEYKPGIGDYDYDAVNDKYVYIGSMQGDYDGHQGIMYIAYVFEINEYMHCPNTHLNPDTVWSKAGNYELQLSEITQVKKGIYSISIVNANGDIATDISSVHVTFYLNKADKSSTPKEGDLYKTVMMKNGTATVRFYMDEFNATGNVLTAVFPTPGTQIDSKVSKSFAIDDENIPGIPLNTSIKISNLNTYPNSNQELVATLTDSNGKAVTGATLTFSINSKTQKIVTDSKGQAKIKISESKESTYVLTVNYVGDDIEYYGTDASCKITVKKTSAKITASNLNMIPKRAEYYSITLKDASGKVLSNQKVTFKVNGKPYTKTTNSKGVAKVKLKFSKNKKTYKIAIAYKGTARYNGVSLTKKITVKYSSKTVKLSAPTVTIPPKTAKYYTVTLKDGNGKAISKQKVTVKINGKKYTKKTNSKGQVRIKVKFSKLKTYKVTAAYKGTKVYKKASSKGKIKVAKTATKITAPTLSMTPKVSKTYTVTLKANNKAFAKQKLTIKVNGKTYTKTTNKKGQASISVNFAGEKTYSVSVNYKGTAIYKASKTTGKIVVSKIATQITAHDRTYSKDGEKNYQIALKDKLGNALKTQSVTFNIDGKSYTKTTDSNGLTTVNLDSLDEGSFSIVVSYAGGDQYKAVSKTNKITVSNKTGFTFIDSDLSNSEIQDILNSAADGTNVEFLGDYYFNIALTVNHGLNILSNDRTILNAKANSQVFTVSADNVNISGFSIQANSGDAIVIRNADNISIEYNFISNNLAESKIPSYVDGTVNLPGYGVTVSNSSNVVVKNNYIDLFESGIFTEYSNKLSFIYNTLKENNYGIKYGFGVANTNVLYNEITENIGYYDLTVPEGPTGYGIFLNNSAVNVTINQNHIYANHLGISVDANFTTGIVITQNTITDNVLEGIRFNAGYDLAENAVKPLVTDNAIYRNARGPSMMILGELSANPFGIYGGGLNNDSQKLQLDANWYGTNALKTWDNDTGMTGYGTMCPRINTTAIVFNETVFISPGTYSITFYKNGEIASNLSKFDLYATLNRGTDKQLEITFDVVNGVGTFSFNATDFNATNNIIEISIGSLIYSTSRIFLPTYVYNVPETEIPA